jgi:hypothetical protein
MSTRCESSDAAASARRANLCRLCGLGMTLLAAVLTAPKASAADPTAAARRLLATRGLVASGGLWVTRRELDIRKRLDGLEALYKRSANAHQQVEALLKRNEFIRAELQRAETIEKQTGKAPPPATPGKSPSGSDAKTRPAERLNSQQPDVTGSGDQTPLQVALIDWINARNALEVAVLDIEGGAAELDRRYAALAADESLRAALEAVGGGRLGPAKDYRRHQRLAAASKDVFTTSVPIYRESGHWRVGAVVDERTPATFSLVEQSQPTLISATLSQLLGLQPDNSPPENQRLSDRDLPVRRAKLKSLRLGKFLFDNVPVFLLPPEAEDLGSQLATGALVGCRARLTRDRMTLELESLAQGGVDRRRAPLLGGARERGMPLARPISELRMSQSAMNWKTETITLRSQ